MELQYEILPLEIKEWFQEPNHLKFLNVPQTDNGLDYGLNITPYDHKQPDFYTFEIIMEKRVGSVTEVNFKAVAIGRFKVKLIKSIIPEPKLYFLFLETATKILWNEMVDRTKNTVHQFHRVALPVFAELEPQLQKYIDHWDKNVRHTVLN
jgi:hypothetical protein